MRVGKVIADYRFANNLGVREVAAEIGTSSATLNRLENNENCDGETMVKVMLWLFAPAEEQRRRKEG